MKMFIKNRLFKLSILVIFIQQIILAASTWSIALAGASVATGKFYEAKTEILSFFGLALAAYVVSSISEILSVKAQNQIWHQYLFNSVTKFCSDISLSSEKNRRSMNQWISSEALSTIQSAVPFYVNFISTTLNIVLTTSVFFLSLGVLIGSIIGVSLIISLALVALAKTKITTLANEVQKNKISALLNLDSLIVNGQFGTVAMARSQREKFISKASFYYGATERYNKLEQAIACTPIILSVFIVSTAIYFTNESSIAQLGILVALLPRSLQLFGSVHSLSMYLSHLVMMGQKIKNLNDFITGLEKQNLENQIDLKKILITNTSTGHNLSIEDLFLIISQEPSPHGRILITGRNGSGKSSLLKTLKSQHDNSILYTPGAHFNEELSSCSTGQLQILELHSLLKSSEKVILLDEWDANLDTKNKTKINSIIDEIALKSFVIEVRHSHSFVKADENF